jgi:hypothetical protein
MYSLPVMALTVAEGMYMRACCQKYSPAAGAQVELIVSRTCATSPDAVVKHFAE